MRELEAHAAEQRLARERALAERQRRWEAAMEQARRRLLEDHRRRVRLERVRAWQDADAFRAYSDAIEARHGRPAIDADSSAGWRSRVPTPTTHRLCRGRPLTPEALKPYLPGWSP